MRRARIVGAGLLVMAFGAVVAMAGDEPKESHHAPVKSPALEPFKALEGKWVGKMNMGAGGAPIDAVVTYKVTSNGSAVMETIDPGGQHEMVTIIHPDGDLLVLTHYCAIGNQPRMKAKADPHKVQFKFVDATNMKSPNDMHMHEVAYTFVGKDTLKSEWTDYMGGKPSETAVFELKRSK